MIEDVKTVISVAKNVVDLATSVKTLSDKGDDLELRGVATELRSQTIDLKGEVNEMRERIIELEDQLKFKEKLSFNGKVFEYEEGGRKRYICNGCEANGKYAHMTEVTRDNGYRFVNCPVCKNEVTLNEGASYMPQETRYSDGF